MGGFLDWLGSKTSDAEDWLGNAWENETSQFTPGIEAIKSAADYGMEKSGQGLDFLTSMLGSTFDPTKPGMMDYTRDPFSQIRLDERGNASAPTIGEQATQTIDQPFIKHLLKSSIDIARNPASALVTNPVVGAAMAPGMIEDTSKRLGTLWSDLGDQGRGLTDPEVQKGLGELLPSAAMTGLGIKGAFHEISPLSEAIPEVQLGGGYTSRSPIELTPEWAKEGAKGSPSPILGTAISEGGMKQIQPPDEAVTSVTDFKPVDERTNAVLKQEHLKQESSDLWEFTGNEIDPHEIQDPTIKAQVAKDNSTGKEYQARQTGKGATTYVNEDGLGIHIDENGNKTTVQNEPSKWADMIMNTVSKANQGSTPPKPIELGTAIDSLARSLGWKDIPGSESRMVPPDSSKLPPPEEILKNIFTVQNPDWEKNPNELHQALLSEAERGDPAGQVRAYIDLISRKQPSRTGVGKNARGIDTSEEKAHIADLKSQLKAEGQYSKSQNKEEVGKSNQEVKLQNQIEKAQNKEELAQKSFKVTLDNGFVSNVRARDANTAKEFVQGYLDRGGNKRTIAKVEPKLSPLEMEAQGLGIQKGETSNKPNPLVDKTAQVLDKLSGGLKSSVMSTGVPGTGISPHGFSTLGRSFGTASYTTPMDNPVVASLKTMKYMAVPSEAVKYLKANEGYAKELEKQSPGFASPTEYSTPQNLLSKAHFKLFAEPLFQKIIPALKIEKAQTMEKFYLKNGMNPEAARTKAIDDANVAFGGLKNWSQSRFNRIALFAPDWLETNARLATGTVKALANPNNPAGRMYRAYLANGLALYALKGAIQYGLTGTSPTSNTLGHKEDINIGKEGIKDLYLRPEGTAYDSYRIPLEIAESIGKAYETGDSKYLGEIARIGVNRLGPLKVFANILFNRDYKGTPLWGKDTYNRPIPLTEDTTTSTGRPFPSTVTRVTNELEGTLPQPITSAGKFIEGTAGPIEFMSKGLGLPLSATSYKIENDFSKKGSSKKKSGYQSRYAF